MVVYPLYSPWTSPASRTTATAAWLKSHSFPSGNFPELGGPQRRPHYTLILIMGTANKIPKILETPISVGYWPEQDQLVRLSIFQLLSCQFHDGLVWEAACIGLRLMATDLSMPKVPTQGKPSEMPSQHTTRKSVALHVNACRAITCRSASVLFTH